jgi:hypothetical protein
MSTALWTCPTCRAVLYVDPAAPRCNTCSPPDTNVEICRFKYCPRAGMHPRAEHGGQIPTDKAWG